MNRYIPLLAATASFCISATAAPAQMRSSRRPGDSIAGLSRGIETSRPPPRAGRYLFLDRYTDPRKLTPGDYDYPIKVRRTGRLRTWRRGAYSDDYGRDRRRSNLRSRSRRYRGPSSRYFDSRRYGGYGHGGYGYGGYGYGGVNRALDDAYEQGHYDADRDYLWYIASRRAGTLLNQYRDMFNEALLMFRDGRYDWAAIKLLGAAEKNQGSASPRLHAGHALFALGRYEDAAELLARAFELSPSLAHKRYDLRDEYGDKADFDRHFAALKLHVADYPDHPGAVTLLGYVTYYSEGPGAAYPYLRHAIRLDPQSFFIPKLLRLSRMASGMQKPPEPAENAGKAPQKTRNSATPQTVEARQA